MTTPVAKTIYVTVGLPYSGKTTAARRLLGPEALLIERDEYLNDVRRDPALVSRLLIQSKSIPSPMSRVAETHEANAYNDALTLEYVRRVVQTIRQSMSNVVIVDGTHLYPLSRSFIASMPDAKKIALVTSASPDECIKRLTASPTPIGVRSTITPEMIQRLACIFEPPTKDEGFDEIRTI